MIRNITYILLFIVLVTLPLSCGKEDHPVPDYWVNFTINLESTQYIELNGIGGWAYFSGGYKGVIIYRWSFDEFKAFDRACPHHPYEACGVVDVTDPPIATCECCGSQYLLIDGSVVEGPSKYPLKQYRTFFQDPYLQVSSW